MFIGKSLTLKIVHSFIVAVTLLAVMSVCSASNNITGTHGLAGIARLTGTPSLNNTTSPYNIGGTDLGIPVSYNNKVYFLFGDTFSGEDSYAGGNWRRNTVSWSSDTTFNNGIVFDDYAVNPSTGQAKQTFTDNTGGGVVTNIPTGGLAVNGKLYAWFMNIIQWGPAGGEWYISQAELARWNDATNDFSVVSNSSFAGNGNFGMVAAREGVAGDPYIYLWGTPAGRFGLGVKLARFLPSQIESRSSYQFYNGNVNGIPQWTYNEFEGDFVVTGSVGEMSVMYNQAVGAWTMLYFNEINDRIEIRRSDTPWGPWSSPVTVMRSSQCPSGTWGLYAPYMHPQWVENNGNTIYFTLSLWSPYDVYMAKVTLDMTPAAATPPTGGVSVNSGAAYTTSRSVILNLSASDDSGTVSQMQISNDGVFDTEPWEAYSLTRAWSLTDSDEQKTVYAKFKDPAGTESSVATDTIILDIGDPSITSAAASPVMVADGDSVHLTVTATDAAGVSAVSVGGAPFVKTGNTTWEKDIIALSDPGLHTLSVTASDIAGHTVSAPVSYTTARIVGTSGRNLADPIMSDASGRWLFTALGRVKVKGTDTFDLDDGSGVVVHVISPGYTGIDEGDYVSARGILTPGATPQLSAQPTHVKKLSD